MENEIFGYILLIWIFSGIFSGPRRMPIVL